MPRMTDIGPVGYKRGAAVATLSYAPTADREALVTGINVLNPSASDTWRVSVGTMEIMAFYVSSVGNQQVLGGLYGNFPRSRNLFNWYKEVIGQDLIVPVPRGMTVTVKSDGGATADIHMRYYDMTIGSVGVGLLNHYQGNRFVLPLYAYLAASVAAAGEKQFDTFVHPAWVDNVFDGVSIVSNKRYTVLAMWQESVGVNTFSGSADHRSTTDYYWYIKGGQRMFTQDTDGIPASAQAAAAGSANKVYAQVDNPHPSFQVITNELQGMLPVPLDIGPGERLQSGIHVAGDVTGGADYSGAILAALVEVVKM